MMIEKRSYLRKPLRFTEGDHRPGRRDVLLKAVSIAGLALLPGMGRAQDPVKPTWMEIIGPFYPVEKPADQDADLTLIAGSTERAQGDILHLSGRVLALGAHRNGPTCAH